MTKQTNIIDEIPTHYEQGVVQRIPQEFELHDWVYSPKFGVGQIMQTDFYYRTDKKKTKPLDVVFGRISGIIACVNYTKEGRYENKRTSDFDIVKITPITTLDQIKVGSMICHADFKVGVITDIMIEADFNILVIHYIYRNQAIKNYNFDSNKLFLTQY